MGVSAQDLHRTLRPLKAANKQVMRQDHTTLWAQRPACGVGCRRLVVLGAGRGRAGSCCPPALGCLVQGIARALCSRRRGPRPPPCRSPPAPLLAPATLQDLSTLLAAAEAHRSMRASSVALGVGKRCGAAVATAWALPHAACRCPVAAARGAPPPPPGGPPPRPPGVRGGGGGGCGAQHRQPSAAQLASWAPGQPGWGKPRAQPAAAEAAAAAGPTLTTNMCGRGATFPVLAGSRSTLARHARLLTPSMFMAHEPQMPSLHAQPAAAAPEALTACLGCCWQPAAARCHPDDGGRVGCRRAGHAPPSGGGMHAAERDAHARMGFSCGRRMTHLQDRLKARDWSCSSLILNSTSSIMGPQLRGPGGAGGRSAGKTTRQAPRAGLTC